MAVTISVYSNANSTSKSINVSFDGDVLASSNAGSITSGIQYYFEIQTNAKDIDRNAIPTQLMLDLDDLALNGQKQSRTNTSNAYSNIKDMIVDYTYDFIYGHDANKYSSGVQKQLPINFG
ncbi:MAG: hypothetical protein ACOCUT_03060 [bacterium]